MLRRLARIVRVRRCEAQERVSDRAAGKSAVDLHRLPSADNRLVQVCVIVRKRPVVDIFLFRLLIEEVFVPRATILPALAGSTASIWQQSAEMLDAR